MQDYDVQEMHSIKIYVQTMTIFEISCEKKFSNPSIEWPNLLGA